MTRIKMQASLLVPQDDNQANGLIADIGRIQRHCEELRRSMDEDIAKAHAVYDDRLKEDAGRITALTKNLNIYCAANRDRLTDGGKTKTINLGQGKCGYRSNPPKVSVRRMKAAIEDLKSRGLTYLIRIKEEVDKDGILSDPSAVNGIDSIKVASSGEMFWVSPNTTDIEATDRVKEVAA